MSQLRIQTPAAQEPVSLATLKNHLRIDIVDDDALLATYLQAAREVVESASGRSLVNKLYRQSHDVFPPHHHGHFGGFAGPLYYREPYYNEHHRWLERHAIKLLRSPLVNVQKIVYTDTTGTPQTLVGAAGIWLAKNEYEIGEQIVDSNGNLQQVTAVTESEDGSESISGAVEPAWNQTVTPPNNTTADGDITWSNMGVAPSAQFQVDADAEPPRVMPLFAQVWPVTQRVPNAVQVFFTAGYGNDAASAPAVLKTAVMQAAGAMYEHREALSYDDLKDLAWFQRLIYAERVRDFHPTP